MWRCHCGEKNLEKDASCRACAGSRATHEDRDPEWRPPVRRKNVYMGALGMGVVPPRDEAGEARILSEEELTDYYRRAGRGARWRLVLYVLAVLAVVGLVAWQILRPPP